MNFLSVGYELEMIKFWLTPVGRPAELAGWVLTKLRGTVAYAGADITPNVKRLSIFDATPGIVVQP